MSWHHLIISNLRHLNHLKWMYFVSSTTAVCRQSVHWCTDNDTWIWDFKKDRMGRVAKEYHNRSNGQHHPFCFRQSRHHWQRSQSPWGPSSGRAASGNRRLQHTVGILQASCWLFLWCGLGHRWIWIVPHRMCEAHLNMLFLNSHHVNPIFCVEKVTWSPSTHSDLPRNMTFTQIAWCRHFIWVTQGHNEIHCWCCFSENNSF